MIKITDWQAWRGLHYERLMRHAQQAGAGRYQIYRNVHDASQTLILAEFDDLEAAREMGRAIHEISTLLPSRLAEDWTWEPTGWEGIDAWPPPPEKRGGRST